MEQTTAQTEVKTNAAAELVAKLRGVFDEGVAAGKQEDAIKLDLIAAGATFKNVTRLFNEFMVEGGHRVSKEERDFIVDKFIMLAKKKIVEEATFSWKMVKAYRDEDGEVRYTIDSFDDWIDEKVDRRDLPEWLSFDDFKEQWSKMRDCTEEEKEKVYKILSKIRK